MVILPQWTERITKLDVVGEDHLGIETAAATYQGELLPGIITVTDHARYYSLYCWILWRFIQDEHQEGRISNLRGAYFKQLELAHTMACYAHHEHGPALDRVIGGQTWGAIWREADPIDLANNYQRQMKSNPLGGFGQYYLTSMQIMGLIGEQPTRRDVYQLTPHGISLAEAFEASISQTRYFQGLQDGDVIKLSHAAALEYGQSGCLCSVALEQGQDRDLLREMLFRLEDGENAKPQHRLRRLSLALLLDLVRQSGEQPFVAKLRYALYLGEYAPGHPYAPLPFLRKTYAGWRHVQARQLYTSALEILWGLFLECLHNEDGDTGNGISFEDFMSWLSYGTLGDLLDTPLVDLLHRTFEEYGLPPNWVELYPHITEGFKFQQDALTLFDQQQQKAEFTAIDALDMLVDLFFRFYDLHTANDPIWQEMAVATQESHRLPFYDFFCVFQSHLESQSTLREVIVWLYREYILAQHEYMAIRKLRYNGYDTFKFHHIERRFYRPVMRYEQPLRHPALRLHNALTMLIDVGLIETRDDIYRLTEDGESFLMQVERLHHGN